MKEEIVNINDTCRSLVYRFDVAELARVKDKVVAAFVKEANIAGFRKGQVPKSIVEKRFGSAISQQVKSSLIDDALEAIQTNHGDLNITEIVETDIDVTSDGAVVNVVIDFIPEFEAPDYRCLSIAGIHVDVSDEEIDKEIKNIFRQQVRYDIVDRAVERGDFVKLSYVGKFSDGSAVADITTIPAIYASQDNTWEEAGNASSPGVRAIVDGVIGTAAGEKKTVTQIFPDDFAVSELAGKDVTYSLEIIEVRVCVFPDLTEELLRPYGVATEEELREKVKNLLLNNKTSQARFNQREELVGKLADMVEVKLPERAIARESQRLVDEFVARQMRQGVPSYDVEERTKGLAEQLRSVSEKRLKVGAILDKLAKAENVTIVAQDIENMIWQDIYSNKLDGNRYISDLKRDNARLADVRRRAVRGKILDSLMSKVCDDLLAGSDLEPAVVASVAE